MTHLVPRVMTFVLAGGKGTRLRPLTENTPKPLVPFAGLFRMIDITLSNCANSQLGRVHVLTQEYSVAIDNYLSEVWNDGVEAYAVPVPPSMGRCYSGTADAVLQNMNLIETYEPDLVLVLSADHVYRMDYRTILQRHIQRNADLTVSVVDVPLAQSAGLGIVRTDREEKITGFEEKPPLPREPGSARVWANQGIYVFNSDVLMHVARGTGRGRPGNDFGRDVLPTLIHSCRSFAHGFQDASTGRAGYWYDVGTIPNYYQAHMDLLREDPPFDPYEGTWPIRRPDGPRLQDSIFDDARHDPEVASIISCDALIRGATIHCSVLSSGVIVRSGADVRASVLLPGVQIGRGAAIRRAVIDAGMEVAAGDVIGYDPQVDRRRFHVTGGGIVVVGKGSKHNHAIKDSLEIAHHE